MNTKYFFKILGVTISLLAVSACGLLPRRGSGDLVTENRQVTNFDRVVFSGAGDVTIIQDGSESATIETDDDVISHVKTEVRGSTLYVGLDFDGLANIIPTRLSIILHVAELEAVSTSGSWSVQAGVIETGRLETEISGTGKIRIDSLSAEELIADINGAGEVDIAGVVDSQQIGISGSGKYLAEDLQCGNATIHISGSGNAKLWVFDTLDVKVSGSGLVDYYGNPQVNFDKSGSGSINGLGEK